jgi:lipoprotein-releasing system permease protein
MFQPLALCIGLRYTRAKKRNHFISFISAISMLGIALGVLVLITVMSVMNGFDREIKDRILTMIPEVTVTSWGGDMQDWQAGLKALTQSPKAKAMGIRGASAFIMGQGMVSLNDVPAFVVLEGIDLNTENQVLPIAQKMIAGKLEDLGKVNFGIVLGKDLAESLGVALGDKVTVIVPETSLSPMGVLPTLKQFTVTGIFQVGYQYDSNYALINLSAAQKLFSLGNAVTGIQLKLNDAFSADQAVNSLKEWLPPMYRAQSWIEQNPNFFKALKMEKMIMFLMLLLIIAVAAFNMLSSLVMLVTDKQGDIAILRTLGCSSGLILRIFMIQGMIIGLIGTALGVIFGVLLSLHVTQITNWFQNLTGTEILNSSVYYIDFIPSKLELADIWHIALISLGLSLISTLYPAWRASKVEPAEALRYE